LSGGRFSQPSATVMNDVYLFELSSQRTAYLSARQTLIAGNVANANTPTYKALDLKPFSAVLQQTSIDMATTNPAHLTPTAQELDPPTPRENGDEYATVSGNSVDVEGEMVKLGEVNRDFGMATGVKKIFRQMFMQALK
jgi:flagellar basal-body rod protein FlgB